MFIARKIKITINDSKTQTVTLNDAIENYTLTRANGQITVTPNS